MVYSEKLLNVTGLMKCEAYHTKNAYIGFALKLPILKEVDFDETYRILKVDGTNRFYKE